MNRTLLTRLGGTVLAALAITACSGRDATCPTPGGYLPLHEGLDAAVACCRKNDQGVHLRIALRNDTDRDAILGKGSDAASAIALMDGGKRLTGTVSLERVVHDPEGPDSTVLVLVPGPLRIKCHSTANLRIDIPDAHPAGQAGAWTLQVEGAWSNGTPIRGDMKITAPPPAAGG